MKKISTPHVGMIHQSVTVLTIIFLLSICKSSNAYANQDFSIRYSWINSNKMQSIGGLPVVLTPLKGYYSKGVSHLYWKSLQESNSSHFEIERSNDGINFNQVGKVIAKSISDKEVDYSYADIRSNAGFNYYRLKLLDKDGKFQYSNIEVLYVNIEGINITGIYPGPFVDKLNITISSEVKTRTIINLFDNTGKLLISHQTDINKGVTNLTVDNLNNLSKGLYFIKVQAGETIILKRLIK